jgi:hypothetical protein
MRQTVYYIVTRATIGRPLLGNGSVNNREAVFSAWSVQRVRFVWVSFCRKLGRVLEMAVEDDWYEMARNELDCAKNTSYVNWSYSEAVINPLPGYD